MRGLAQLPCRAVRPRRPPARSTSPAVCASHAGPGAASASPFPASAGRGEDAGAAAPASTAGRGRSRASVLAAAVVSLLLAPAAVLAAAAAPPLGAPGAAADAAQAQAREEAAYVLEQRYAATRAAGAAAEGRLDALAAGVQSRLQRALLLERAGAAADPGKHKSAAQAEKELRGALDDLASDKELAELRLTRARLLAEAREVAAERRLLGAADKAVP